MGIQLSVPDTTIEEHEAPVANYGRSTDGAGLARDDAWGHMNDNAGLKNQLGGAQNYANGQAAGAQNRGATAFEDNNLSNAETNSRNGYQNSAIGMAKTLAYGNQPSEGAYQLQNGLNQGLAQQKSIAGSARGGAALATAGADQGANSANLQQNGYMSGQVLRASDMAAGRGLYGSLIGQQRDQDAARQQQANDMSQYNAQANDKYGLGMGAAGVGFGSTNNAADQTNQNYYGMGMSPIEDQDNANQQGQGWIANNQTTKVANNSQDDSGASGWLKKL